MITLQMEVANEYPFSLGFQAKSIGSLSRAVLVENDWFNDGKLKIMSMSIAALRVIESQFKAFLCMGTNGIFFSEEMKVMKGIILTVISRMKQFKLKQKVEKAID